MQIENPTSKPFKGKKIFMQIALIMDEVQAVGKDKFNDRHNYQFRGIDDIYNALHDLLAKHKVFCMPEVRKMQRMERRSRSGGVLIETLITVDYFFFADDGSYISSRVIGESMDTGDKGVNKAMSSAQKYAFLQIFAIPTNEPKDSENKTFEIGDDKNKARSGNQGQNPPTKTNPKPATNQQSSTSQIKNKETEKPLPNDVSERIKKGNELFNDLLAGTPIENAPEYQITKCLLAFIGEIVNCKNIPTLAILTNDQINQWIRCMTKAPNTVPNFVSRWLDWQNTKNERGNKNENKKTS